jgi:Xaa-Pro aminopeptidase
MKIKEKIEALRKLMRENEMDAYIVPSFDAHQSEYVAEHWKSRQWISGFTGSAGTAVITLEDAGLWTDGRYYIQAEKQLEGSGMRLFKAAEPETPSFAEWLKDVLKKDSTVGFDGTVFSVDMVKDMHKEFDAKNIGLKFEQDLINELWSDRPEIPKSQVFVHDVKYAGKSRTEKLNQVREEMTKLGANHYLLTSLDDIAWLLNIRGNDVQSNPVVISNVVIGLDKCYLFIDSSKLSKEIKSTLEAESIEIKGYNELEKFLAKLTNKDTVIFDSCKTNICLYNAIDENVKKVEKFNITTSLKGIKNEVEIENLINCEVMDGVAMVKFIKWLKTSVAKEKITEISAADKLEEFRSQIELFAGLSFDTIGGYKDHAAMMHYKATEESQYTLKNEGFFLVDSGGQYYNGTTDTTRTIVLGKLTEEEKRDYTLVLKAHIGLSTAKFLHGSTGANLDVLARQPIWKYGIDYKCGTGHGVGFFLNVHEGPQGFRANNYVKLEKGMILTNEPGIYKEGKFGIRTENIMLVVEDEKTEFGQFMKFEPITYCPIDLDGINSDMLTIEEKQWLNDYHKDVFSRLSPYLNEEEKQWLKEEMNLENK